MLCYVYCRCFLLGCRLSFIIMTFLPYQFKKLVTESFDIMTSDFRILPGKAFLALRLYTVLIFFIILLFFSFTMNDVVHFLCIFLCGPRNGTLPNGYPVAPTPLIGQSASLILCLLNSHTYLDCLLKFV